MKKYISKIINLCLILALSLATVFCCNSSATQAAAASHSSVVMAKTEKAMPACHRHRNQTPIPTKSDCSCCINKQLQADQPIRISFYAPQIVIGYSSLAILLQQQLVLKAKFNLAFLDGPPGPISDSPLYIHFHNIRI